MQTYEFVTLDFPIVTSSQELSEVLPIFIQHRIQTLPVVDKQVYKGIVHFCDVVSYLYSSETKKKKAKSEDGIYRISDIKQSNIGGALHISHFMDVVQFFDQNQIDIVPIVDEKNKYIGCVLQKQVNRMIADFLDVYDNGAIIEVEFTPYNYSISELVKLIEEQNARISSLLWLPENTVLHRHRIMLKLNMIDGSRIVDVLQRNGFQARISTYQASSEQDLKDRADEFLKYLNV